MMPFTGPLGFYEMGSNRVVDIQECLCLTPALNKVLKSLRTGVCSQTIPGLREIECYENDNQETAVFYHPPVPQTDTDASERSYNFLSELQFSDES